MYLANSPARERYILPFGRGLLISLNDHRSALGAAVKDPWSIWDDLPLKGKFGVVCLKRPQGNSLKRCSSYRLCENYWEHDTAQTCYLDFGSTNPSARNPCVGKKDTGDVVS